MTEGNAGLGSSGPPADSESEDARRAFERLRRLLLEQEQEEIRRLRTRLDDPVQHAREVGDVLAEAVAYRNRKGPGLERALGPALEGITHRAIRRDPRAFAEALFPVIGPAIRKAIAEALKGMIQSLNRTLELGFSLRGLRWRLEAIRTGRPFAEVVLSRTLLFRVEQLFLIHRESGLLLHHLTAPEVEAQDADMVSGMLSAIQDFVRDSFKLGQGEGIESLEVGDLQVWVERGPRAVLAAALRGSAPLELRASLQEALETIHLELGGELAAFSGDAAPFVRAQTHLEPCLQSRTATPARAHSPRLWLLLGLLLLLVGWWGVPGWLAGRRLDRLLSALRAEPGIVVTGVEREGGRAVVHGLRDPLAKAPQPLVAEAGLDPARVELRLQGYQSVDGPFVLARARTALEPPPTVRLTFADGELTAAGDADQAWIARARQVAPVLFGVTAYRDGGLVDAEQAQLKRRVEAHLVRFPVASAAISANERAGLAEVAEVISELARLAAATGRAVRVRVEGFADPTGGEDLNLRLSQERARAVFDLLLEEGVASELLSTVGLGSPSAVDAQPEAAGNELERWRKVALVVEIGMGDAGQGVGP